MGNLVKCIVTKVATTNRFNCIISMGIMKIAEIMMVIHRIANAKIFVLSGIPLPSR